MHLQILRRLFPVQGAEQMRTTGAIPASGENPPSGVNLNQTEGLPRGGPSLRGQAEKVLGYILGNQATWMAAIGLKAGLFRAISNGPEKGISAEALSAATGFNQNAVQAWCRSAYAFGFLEWEELSGYRLEAHMEKVMLKPNHPNYLGGQIEFYAALNESYRIYPKFLRSEITDRENSLDPWLLDALRNLTRPDAIMITEHVLPQVPKTLGRIMAGGILLDIGAGEGDHVIHYALRFPRSRVIGIELDPSKVEIARKKIAEASLEGQAAIREGDVNHLGEDNTYDLITLNLTLHDVCTGEQCAEVLGRVFRALKPEGTLLVSEFPYPDSIRGYREGTFCQFLSGIQLHLTMVGCRMITQKQLWLLMEQGRFENVRVATQPNPTRFVLLGEKSKEK
jgi:ubiquinone/menaquinone biosynthesis C-methylase UbiE